MLHHKFALALGAAIGVAGLTIFAAQAADATRVRGTVAQFEGSTLTVKTREGATDAIKLTDGFKISGVAKASLEDIKVGDFVGITSVPKDDGGEGALEVVIFPAALKGTGEGRRPWDLKPNSKMNNATVANAVTGVRRPHRDAVLQGRPGEEDLDPDRYADRHLRQRHPGRSRPRRRRVRHCREGRGRRLDRQPGGRRQPWDRAADVGAARHAGRRRPLPVAQRAHVDDEAVAHVAALTSAR